MSLSTDEMMELMNGELTIEELREYKKYQEIYRAIHLKRLTPLSYMHFPERYFIRKKALMNVIREKTK